MEKLIYVDRRNTNCNKWDGQYKMFGEEGLHAMWVADMDFLPVPEIKQAIIDYGQKHILAIIILKILFTKLLLIGRKRNMAMRLKRERFLLLMV
mgnify:CR=1 FL=1